MSSRTGQGTREWDAATYDRVSVPQQEWGRAVLERLDLQGDETVLDAGCGSGRVTERLLEQLPRGRVIAVDGSAAMVEHARERFRRLGELNRVELIHSDLLDLEVEQVADAVFSSATFHWIDDHQRLFGRIFSWLRPGGRLEAQCGGEGNVARFLAHAEQVASREPYARHLAGIGSTRHFASAEASAQRLRAAGFERIRCELEPSPMRLAEPRTYIESVCLGAHTEALPEELRGGFVEAVAALWLGNDEERAEGPLLDYIRLNLSARRPGASSS